MLCEVKTAWIIVGVLACAVAPAVAAETKLEALSYNRDVRPIMENIAITSQYDVESRKQMVKRLAGIKD